MADISKLSRLLNGVQRQVDLATNTIVFNDFKIGGASGTLVTKTIVDALVGGPLVDGSLYHNHDSLYYTETELGSVTNGSSGASLIGVDQTPAFTNFSGATVQAALESIDSALTTASSVEFLDSTFRVKDDGDNTKQMAFQLSGLTTATTRTLTLQDKNIIVAGTANETFSGTTIVDKLQVDGQAHSPINSQVASVSSTINWNNGNVQRITLDQNTTLTFSNGADGGQYLLIIDQDGTGGRSLSFPSDVEFVGATPTIQQGANDRTIVSFFYDPSQTGDEYQGLSSNDIISMANGGTGANLSPVAGGIVYTDANSMEISAAGSAGQVLQSNGASAPSWLTLAGGNGLSYSAGTFDVDLATDPGLEFDSAALRVKIDAAGGVLRGASGLSVAVDNSTIELNANALRVKADGIKSSHVAFLNNTALRIRNAADSAYVDVVKLNASDDIVFASLPKDSTVPTDNAHLVNKLYVDTQVSAAAAGLDPKESVRVATVAVLAGTMIADNGTPATGERSYNTTNKTITWFAGEGPSAIDGVTLANGNRILVKNESATSGPSAGEGRVYNGIYTRTSADVWTRSADQDGTPAHEISGGNFTFVEQGTLANSGWVLTGNGTLTLQTDNIIWTQFSASGAFIGGDGIDISSNIISVDLATNSGLEFSAGELQVDLLANGGLKLSGNEIAVEAADIAGQGLKDDGSDNLALDFNGLSAESAVAAGDLFAFGDVSDSNNHKKITWAQMLTKSAGAGLALNTDVLDVQVGDGIEISSDAVALNIDGIAGTATDLQSTDLFPIHDASGAGNAKITVANMLGKGLDLTSGKIAVQLGNGLEFDSADDAKLAFDILSAETAMAVGDTFAFHDLSAAGDTDHKKITLANLLTQLAGDGLAVDTDKLKVVAGEGVKVDAGDDRVELDLSSLSAETTIANTDELVFYDVSASSHKKITRQNLLGDLSQISETMVAGESFEANTVHAVRIAISGETAGRVYKATNDASVSDRFYVLGFAINRTGSAITAGSNISVVKLGGFDLEASDLSAVAGDIGKPVFLSTAGDLTLTAPTAADTAVVRIGLLREHSGGGTHKLEAQFQVMGVN